MRDDKGGEDAVPKEERMRPKKILAEVSLASLLTGVWVAGCYLIAAAAASSRKEWWEIEAWGAW